MTPLAAAKPVATASPASPFGAAPPRAPLAASPPPAPRPFWELPKPTAAQLFIAASFVTISALMLGTFAVVLGSGGIHFNE